MDHKWSKISLPFRSVATLGDQSHRTAKSNSVDCGELFQDSACRRTRGAVEHGSIHAPSPFPDADFHEPAPVSKAAAASVSAKPDAEQRYGMRRAPLSRWATKVQRNSVANIAVSSAGRLSRMSGLCASPGQGLFEPMTQQIARASREPSG